MTLIDLAWVIALAFGQVGVLLGSQKLLPEYYFASAQFFVTRGEFKWKAISFRLAIPFTAGLLVPMLPGIENDRLVAGHGERILVTRRGMPVLALVPAWEAANEPPPKNAVSSQ